MKSKIKKETVLVPVMALSSKDIVRSAKAPATATKLCRSKTPGVKVGRMPNSDGWVDAKVLLDRSFYELGALTWLEQAQN
ncbi:hypothetical protein [Bdellovibrio bacteriovorus]|uniref:hypothetical protein n=1 Tax=Bdellovibrio bacteriovorus TaxID=959 RepID=UPI0035A6F608